MRLERQVALITGASRGIGRAIALRFGREGAAIAAVGRSMEPLRMLARELEALGREVLCVSCDVGDDEAVRHMARRAEEHFGRVDVLVNNAGYFNTLHPVQETPDSEWEYTLRVNLTSAFYVSRAVLPGMISRRHGSVIMVSSSAAKAAYPFGSPYSAAKAGLLGLTRALAAEVGPFGIRVNAICPGIVQGTEMHEKVNREVERMTGLAPEERLSAARNSLLLRRLVTPEEVADVALFLASADSDSLTGQTVNVDGGMLFS